jgi:four helix bundle protein
MGDGTIPYTADYVRFLTYALASCDETKAHLELLHETGSIRPERFQYFYSNYRKAGGMLYNLRRAVIDGRAK